MQGVGGREEEGGCRAWGKCKGEGCREKGVGSRDMENRAGRGEKGTGYRDEVTETVVTW